ncbi:hypothetical protein [Macrococcoides caseolyticum]|uniref:hypothetical protein n=1 Tax=Macrococcoides caseolyticum TaxID=69966 RepID=UPI001F19A437|nr:hypothetical protein [Macrococcus caseolyticus]MCE4957410.1 hypothetical protein [Macrococcus caseolyticus]
MKKILLACFIVLLILGALLDTRNYVLGNRLEISSALMPEGEFETVSDAEGEMGYLLESQGISDYSVIKRLYKLPNRNYYTLEILDATYKQSEYLYTGLIETKHATVSNLKVPKSSFELVRVNQQFKDKSWEIPSKVGVFHMSAGTFDNEATEDRIITNDAETAGVTVSLTPKKGIVEVNHDGVWLDHAKFKVGMENRMKRYSSEDAAVEAVKQGDFGKQIGMVKTQHMHCYIFLNKVAEYNEYTFIPVMLQDGQFMAGKFERFTYETDDIVDIGMEEAIEGIPYKIYLQQNNEHPKVFKNEIRHKDMHIAVVERGVKDGK